MPGHAVCIVLAACGGDGAGGASTSTGSGARADGYPIAIQNCGRTLTFDQPPSRAVLPWHPIAPKEQMLSLRPDFVLAYAGYDYDENAGLATVDQLEAAGSQVYTVICPTESSQPQAGETLEGVYRTILDLGTISTYKSVRRNASRPLNLDGEILAAAGGQNVFPDEPAYFQASLESVAARPVDAFGIFPDFAEPTATPRRRGRGTLSVRGLPDHAGHPPAHRHR